MDCTTEPQALLIKKCSLRERERGERGEREEGKGMCAPMKGWRGGPHETDGQGLTSDSKEKDNFKKREKKNHTLTIQSSI
jgi:hypothetical protein